jgi:hypothetical protein
LRVRRLRLWLRSILARWLGGLLRFLGSVPLVLRGPRAQVVAIGPEPA